jgi:hypothetical protein
MKILFDIFFLKKVSCTTLDHFLGFSCFKPNSRSYTSPTLVTLSYFLDTFKRADTPHFENWLSQIRQHPVLWACIRRSLTLLVSQWYQAVCKQDLRGGSMVENNKPPGTVTYNVLSPCRQATLATGKLTDCHRRPLGLHKGHVLAAPRRKRRASR